MVGTDALLRPESLPGRRSLRLPLAPPAAFPGVSTHLHSSPRNHWPGPERYKTCLRLHSASVPGLRLGAKGQIRVGKGRPGCWVGVPN